MDCVTCETCGGTGEIDDGKYSDVMCPDCNGEGTRPLSFADLREAHIAGQNAAREGVRNVKFADEWLSARYGMEVPNG